MKALATFINLIVMLFIVALPILACSYSDDLMMMPHDTASSSEPAITPELNDDNPATSECNHPATRFDRIQCLREAIHPPKLGAIAHHCIMGLRVSCAIAHHQKYQENP